MEIELKYLTTKETAEKLIPIGSPNCREIEMYARYMDTPDLALRKEHVSIRLRKENDKYILTKKWGGNSENGLHRRGEENTEVSSDWSDPSLITICETKFTRWEYDVKIGEDTTTVMSYDEGEILASGRTEPISEIEIELKEGSEEELISFGRMLELKYNLIPSDKSKYSRGLALR